MNIGKNILTAFCAKEATDLSNEAIRNRNSQLREIEKSYPRDIKIINKSIKQEALKGGKNVSVKLWSIIS